MWGYAQPHDGRQTLVEGRRATIRCPVVPGHPELRVQWRANGRSVTAGPEFGLEDNGATLVIFSVHHSHAGLYLATFEDMFPVEEPSPCSIAVTVVDGIRKSAIAA